MRKPEFRKDLEIVDEQLLAIQAIYDARNKFLATSNPAEMTPEQRATFALTGNARLVEFEKRAEEILLPHQQRRLAQIRLQYQIDAQGPTAGLNHPRMRERVKLTELQVEKITSVADAANAKLRDKLEKLQREIKDAKEEARRVILSELTDEQRRLYQEAVGEVADYPLR
jgi:hypothetical protein